jgi:hypothetical protein
MISPPMIRMSQYGGPWPKCLGIDCEECLNYIESYAEDLGLVVIIPPNTTLTDDFRKDRVRIFVDDDCIVTAIPDRG